jgi:hypothetical protein
LNAFTELGQERKIQIEVVEIEPLAALEIIGNLALTLHEDRNKRLSFL